MLDKRFGEDARCAVCAGNTVVEQHHRASPQTENLDGGNGREIDHITVRFALIEAVCNLVKFLQRSGGCLQRLHRGSAFGDVPDNRDDERRITD